MPPKRSNKVVAAPTSAPAKKAKLTKVYCHQDHKPHDPSTSTILRCTALLPPLKFAAKGSARPTCKHAYCARCLLSRYGIVADEVVQKGWKCPSCCGNCNCSVCRRKSNEGPARGLTALLKSRGLSSAAELLAHDGAVASTSSLTATPKPNNKTPRQRTTVVVGPFPSISSKHHSPRSRPQQSSPQASASKPTPSPFGAPRNSFSTLPHASTSTSPPKAPAPLASSLSPPKPKSTAPPSLPRSVSHPRKATASLPHPQPLLNPSRKPRGPRAPLLTRPPRSLLLRETMPTSLLLARLNVRSFLIRFAGIVPLLCEVVGEKKLGRRMEGMMEWLEGLEKGVLEREGAWGVEGEDGQRGVVEGLLELLRGESEEVVVGEDEETEDGEKRKGDVERVLAEVRKARNAGSLVAKRRYWAEVGDFVGAAKDREEVEEWREWIGEAEGQHEVDGAERMRCLAGLVELAYESEEVREAMAEGNLEERTKKIELNRRKFKARNELADKKKELLASRPLEPIVSPSKRGLAEKELAQASWKKQVNRVDAKIARAIKEEHAVQAQIQHAIHLATIANRVRFSSGTDTLGNSYYILPTTPRTSHPTFDDNAPRPLSWSVLIYGIPFLRYSAPAHVYPVEPKWFLVDKVGQLADYVEWGRKVAVFEERGDEVAEVAQLVGSLRAFEGYCEVEREKAEKGDK